MIFSKAIVEGFQRHRGVLVTAALSLGAGVALSVFAAHLMKRPAPPQVAVTAPAAAMVEAPAVPEQQAPPIPREGEKVATVVDGDAAPAAEPAPTPAVTEVAAVPVPVPVPAPASAPAWRRYAVPVKAATRPMVAVIIDDMGLDRRRSARVVALPGPLTISYMSYATHLAEQAAEARGQGHELMMHMPMQPLSDKYDAGPDALLDGLPAEELQRRVEANLGRFSGYVGVNNHMGSRFTADGPGMRVVMAALKKRGLLFIDSMTTGKSTGQAMARAEGVPTAARDVFLDDVDDRAAIGAELAKLEAQARKTGMAIAIGHPRDKTIEALAAWLPSLAEKGITLVPVTAVVSAKSAKN